MNSSWKLDNSKTNILPFKWPFNKSKTDFENGLPIFPARIGFHSFVLNISVTILTVVDFPLEPVTATIRCFVNLLANSISLMIGIFSLLAFFITLASLGIPGETIHRSES